MNEQCGWFSAGEKLYFTEDGGSNWIFKYEFPQLQGSVVKMEFINDSIGFILNGKLYRTIDSGNSWASIIDTLPYISCMSFHNDSLGYIGNSPDAFISRLYKTTNLGSTWIFSHEIGSFYGSGFQKVHALDENIAFASYYLPDWVIIGFLIKTTDQGSTWNIINNSPFGIRDFEFISEQEGWISRYSGRILRTSNGGLIWDTLQYPSLMKFEFFNSNISYGISETHIYYTNDGWVTFSIVDSIFTDIENQEFIISDYVLHQNFPNPFNPLTKIKYEIPKRSWITLKIYDVLGKEVQTLVAVEKDRGQYEATFDASNLASGIYIYKLQAGEFVKSKKMILLR